VAEEKKAGQPQYPVNAAHLMRTNQLAQLQLSAMADHKASILMGATFVIFTIIIGKAQGSTAPLPLLILGGGAFFSAIFAVLTVLPVTRRRKPDGKANILFFSVFTQMEEEEYIEQLLARLESDDSIYRTMARDIYQAGTVLQNKKYRMLGLAYRTFLIGLVASCAAYVALYLT
jgi:Pycsar effector protein